MNYKQKLGYTLLGAGIMAPGITRAVYHPKRRGAEQLNDALLATYIIAS